MSKKTTQLEVEITDLKKELNVQLAEINSLKKQLGYAKHASNQRPYHTFYIEPYISIGNKVDGLYRYLELGIKKIEKEEQIIVTRERAVRPKYSTRAKGIGEKNASKKQKE